MTGQPLTQIPSFQIASLEAQLYRAPIEVPLVNSFGRMASRPAIAVRVEDLDGVVGWGETWCNWPSFGAEHRVHVLHQLIRPRLLGNEWESPTEAFHALSSGLQIMAVQTGETGPIAQAIAGVDIALWDLVAKKMSLPLWRLLRNLADDEAPAGAAEGATVAVYASGLNPGNFEAAAAARRAAGYRAFKLKVGFDDEADIGNVETLRRQIGDSCRLMIDANQAWTLDTAVRMSEALAAAKLFWLEEPIRVDSPDRDWQTLAAESSIPLAGGENLASDEAFNHALRLGALDVVQPDLAKWGGFSRCLPLAQRITGAGKLYCPHYLGGQNLRPTSLPGPRRALG